jgi:hypothetical protein
MGLITVAAGQTVSASHMNLALGQGVLRFASASERTTQVTAPTEGMVSYLLDTDRLETWDGSAWVPAGARKGGYFGMLRTETTAALTAGARIQVSFTSIDPVTSAPGYRAPTAAGSAGAYTGWTVPVTGLWFLNGLGQYAHSATGAHSIDFTLDGAIQTFGVRSCGNGGGTSTQIKHSSYYPLAAGKVIGIQCGAWGAASTFQAAVLQIAGPF